MGAMRATTTPRAKRVTRSKVGQEFDAGDAGDEGHEGHGGHEDM
jgi:hypothetical protein